jgi:hypothetical protein
MHNKSHKLDSASFRTFLFQGKAFFTMHNIEKDTHITFRVQTLKRKRGQPEDTRYFDVYVKALNDKYQGNRYIGRIDRKSKSFKPYGYVERDHVGIQTIEWIIRNWANLEEWEKEGKLAIYHLGSCCKCGLPLTVPESIQNGIGPQCMKYREGKSVDLLKELGFYKQGKGYVDMVMDALDQRPDLFDKLFIPDVVRRTSDWFNKMTTYSEFGLF